VMRHKGRIFKVMGDGFLIEFGSAVDAVAAALEMQRATTLVEASADRRLLLRVGVNLGDVIDDGSDVLGDGVNVAARLETLAAPGGICISAKVHGEIVGKIGDRFFDAGERYLKNLARPVHVWHWPDALQSILPLPECPSIAVLPFTNTSGDEADAPFVDGLTEDLITDLSRNPGLFVIARHSTFAYKGKSPDVRAVARELGVRYILEGSARRAGGRVRINVQLIDAACGDHIWAERFDRNLEDIFGLQDEVTDKIVEALVGRLARPPSRKRPKSLEAYDLCVRGRILISAFNSSPEALREAKILLNHAVSIDAEYGEAFRCLAFVYWQLWAQGIEPTQENRSRAFELAHKAVALDEGDAASHWFVGYLWAYEKRWSESDQAFATTFTLEPNNADALAIRSELVAFAGRGSEAVELAQRALRLNPHPPGWYYWQLGFAHYAACQYEEAVKILRMEAIYRSPSRRILAASLAQLGRTDEAMREAALFMAMAPKFTISHWAAAQPARDPQTVQRFIEGYRMAGLPE